MTKPARISTTAIDAATTKIVFRAGDIFVKVHVTQRDRGYGKLNYLMTGSLCDANGKAILKPGAALKPESELTRDDYKIHSDAHIVSIRSQSATDVKTLVDEGFEAVIERVRIAAENEKIDPLAA